MPSRGFREAPGKGGVPFLFPMVCAMPSKVRSVAVAFWGVRNMFPMHGMSVCVGKSIAPLLGSNGNMDKTTEKNLLNLKFVVSVPFNTNSAQTQLSFLSTFYSTQNLTSTLSEGHVLWMLFSTKGSPAADPVGTSHVGSKFSRGLPVPTYISHGSVFRIPIQCLVSAAL
jgi:hypothetical protein